MKGGHHSGMYNHRSTFTFAVAEGMLWFRKPRGCVLFVRHGNQQRRALHAVDGRLTPSSPARRGPRWSVSGRTHGASHLVKTLRSPSTLTESRPPGQKYDAETAKTTYSSPHGFVFYNSYKLVRKILGKENDVQTGKTRPKLRRATADGPSRPKAVTSATSNYDAEMPNRLAT